MSDIVCVMHGGIIQQAAAPLDIYLRPANRFVATFVGANNFLEVDRTSGGAVLRSGAANVAARISAEGPVTCAIRPEDIHAHPPGTPIDPGRIVIAAKMREISFLGREMEIFAVTEDGEEIKAVARPDPAIVALPPESPVTLTVDPDALSFFAQGDNGDRLP